LLAQQVQQMLFGLDDLARRGDLPRSELP